MLIMWRVVRILAGNATNLRYNLLVAKPLVQIKSKRILFLVYSNTLYSLQYMIYLILTSLNKIYYTTVTKKGLYCENILIFADFLYFPGNSKILKSIFAKHLATFLLTLMRLIALHNKKPVYCAIKS